MIEFGRRSPSRAASSNRNKPSRTRAQSEPASLNRIPLTPTSLPSRTLLPNDEVHISNGHLREQKPDSRRPSVAEPKLELSIDKQYERYGNNLQTLGTLRRNKQANSAEIQKLEKENEGYRKNVEAHRKTLPRPTNYSPSLLAPTPAWMETTAFIRTPYSTIIRGKR